MPRRRVLTFSAYTRRKWRAVGLTVVLMAATLLYLTITDRGHEPVWNARAGDVEQVAASPDGEVLLVVTRTGDRVTGVRGHAIESGGLLWETALNLTAPLSVTAGDGWFAVASPFPRARLMAFDAEDGTTVLDEFLDGEPRAVSADGRALVVALRSGTLVTYEDLEPVSERHVDGLVSTVHAAGGRVAVGTSGGRVLVLEQGREVLNASTNLQPQSLRLTRDGTHLFAAGAALGERGFSGSVAAFDVAGDAPGAPAWQHAMSARVGFVDADADGRILVAVEETLPHYTLHGWDTERGTFPRWSRVLDGAVYRDGAGLAGGVALSADGRLVAVTTQLGGDITLLDAETGRTLWTYAADGATSVSFPSNVADGRFGANARLVATRPFDHVLVFDAAHEPLHARFPAFALALVGLEAFGGFAAIGAGYLWYRRS